MVRDKSEQPNKTRDQDLRACILSLSEHAKSHGGDVSRTMQKRIFEIYGQYVAVRRQRPASMAIRRLYPARCLIFARIPSRTDTAGIHRATNPALSRCNVIDTSENERLTLTVARAAASCLPRDRHCHYVIYDRSVHLPLHAACVRS